MLKAWDGCQKYFYRSWARRTALQSALQHASKVIPDTQLRLNIRTNDWVKNITWLIIVVVIRNSSDKDRALFECLWWLYQALSCFDLAICAHLGVGSWECRTMQRIHQPHLQASSQAKKKPSQAHPTVGTSQVSLLLHPQPYFRYWDVDILLFFSILELNDDPTVVSSLSRPHYQEANKCHPEFESPTAGEH